MIDDAGAAQAKALLREMYQHVIAISHEIEKAERRAHAGSVRAATNSRRIQSALRRELYEAHRLIDGMHGRYPETLARNRPAHNPAQ